MKIISAEALMCEIAVPMARVDARQSFTAQQTVIVRVQTDEGIDGVGYAYTIGTGGHAVLALLRHDLLPAVLGLDPRRREHVWSQLHSTTHATTTGAITSLALAAIDTAVWDICCRKDELPLWQAAGGFRDSVPTYQTEGGWLQRGIDELVSAAVSAQRDGFHGFKIKVGMPRAVTDLERLTAVRDAVGASFALMTDANQSLTMDGALQRARLFEPLDIAWLEEPFPSDNVDAHVRLAAATSIPIAVGESLYSVRQVQQYIQRHAASVIQLDVARIGGITPWLKAAHLAEAADLAIAPHFLMELHVSLAAAVPNATYVEHIPQLGPLLRTQLVVDGGYLRAPAAPGIGIDWDHAAIDAAALLARSAR